MTAQKILYLDPFSGIAGDMLIGAMLDLGLDLARLHHELAKLNLAGYSLSSKRVMRGSMTAIKFDVEIDGTLETARDHAATLDALEHDHGHSHGHEDGHEHGHSHSEIGSGVQVQRDFSQIEALINGSTLSPRVKAHSLKAFYKLAQAEGRIHNMPPEKVHFHEVGALDSLIDMIGACVGLELLNIDEVWCGPLALGSGFVKCQHGLMPVPAPATLELVRGLPLRASPVEKELTTPTGAALAAALASHFGPIPPMRIEKIGYGAGSRVEQAVPNVLRVLMGTIESPAAAAPASNESESDTIVEIQTNVDDTSGEVLGNLTELLFELGALDVFFTPIQMKKSRPATLVTVLAEPAQLEAVADAMFKECTTFGLRYQHCSRFKLARKIVEVVTPYGKVRVKVGAWRGQESSIHPEFEDCRILAREKGVSVRAVIDSAHKCYVSNK